MPDDSSRAAETPPTDAIGDYTANLAHDLNNVFSVVIGSLGIVLEEYAERPLDDEAVTLVEDAVSAGREGARLVEALLAAAGRQALRRTTVDVAAVLGEVAARARHTLGPSTAVAVDVAPDAGDVWTDHERMRQALAGLVDNAGEAMPGGGTVRLSARAAALPGGARGVAIRVSDTGVGMSAEVLARARDPFFSTHTPRRGRGLGLSVADGFARQSAGTLHVHSQPGAGTTVTVHLPLAG